MSVLLRFLLQFWDPFLSGYFLILQMGVLIVALCHTYGSFGPFFKVKRHIFGAILQQKHLVKMLVQLRHDYPWKPKEFLPFSFVDGEDRLTSSKLQWHFSNNVYLIIVKKYALVLLKGEKLMKRERFCSRASRNNFFFLRSIASSSSYLSCAGARRHRPITSTQSSPHLHTYSFNLILSSSCQP